MPHIKEPKWNDKYGLPQSACFPKPRIKRIKAFNPKTEKQVNITIEEAKIRTL